MGGEHDAMRLVIYKRYLLGLLTSLLTFNFVDRCALGLVLQSIKIDLDLTDTQLGFLSGIAFALFYATMGIPIALWADRGNRARIISLTAGLWSVAVALCGFAGSFVELLIIRIGVAVGEAGGFVPGFSLLADFFTRAERPRAIAIYGVGPPLSAVIGYGIAGWLNELYGWRVMFVLLGAPGMILAFVAWFTLKEPRCGGLEMEKKSPMHKADTLQSLSHPTLREVLTKLSGNATFRQLLLCLSVLFFFAYGILQWLPTFFMRSYRLTSGEIGTWFAFIYASGGLLGTYFGGAWASRFAIHNERLQLNASALALSGCAVLSLVVYISTNYHVALAIMVLVLFLQAAINGPLYATIQTLVPERMRAMAIALVMLVANLIGMGMGPLATGMLSDALRPWAGEESLRFALLILTPGYLWAAWHAWRASKTVGRDLSEMEFEGKARWA